MSNYDFYSVLSNQVLTFCPWWVLTYTSCWDTRYQVPRSGDGPVPDYLNPVYPHPPDILYQVYPDLYQTFLYPVYTDLYWPTNTSSVSWPALRCLWPCVHLPILTSSVSWPALPVTVWPQKGRCITTHQLAWGSPARQALAIVFHSWGEGDEGKIALEIPLALAEGDENMMTNWWEALSPSLLGKRKHLANLVKKYTGCPKKNDT